MAEEITPEEKDRIKQMVDDLVERAKIASKEYMKLDQETINQIIKKMSMAGLENHMKLAKMAVEETGRGIYEDKITKNMFATEYIYHSIKYDKTVGVIAENEEEDFYKIKFILKTGELVSENLPNGKLDIGENFGKYGFTITKQELEEKEDNVSAYVLQRHASIDATNFLFFIHKYHIPFIFFTAKNTRVFPLC